MNNLNLYLYYFNSDGWAPGSYPSPEYMSVKQFPKHFTQPEIDYRVKCGAEQKHSTLPSSVVWLSMDPDFQSLYQS